MEWEDKDLLLRYGHILKKRTNNKNKDKFIKSFVKDTVSFRKDISVIEHKKNGSTFKNIYVGDIKNAKTIVATYYDTPSHYLGDYNIFDRKEQNKKTTKFILLSSLIYIILGFAILLFYMKTATDILDFKNYATYIYIAMFGIYFYIMGKIARGIKSRHNIIRNTSSVLFILKMMKMKKKYIAYALFDNGCYGSDGIEAVEKMKKPNANIYCLDSIGSDANIASEFINGINYIFTYDMLIDKGYILHKNTLKKSDINYKNYDIVSDSILEGEKL